MSKSSEDVLLQMSEVRYKKGDGVLYVMNERLAWMAENRDTVAVSHRFQDIKSQKISPEGKPKIQLQLVLHDSNSSTFHFVNKNGVNAQIQDRDKVKEILQQLLPNFKRAVDKELEEKNRILSENATLLQLYKDLVITQVITSEEFWAQHASHHTKKNVIESQTVGVSGAFLADIKPQTDGCNGLKYNLTNDIINCIFKTYPAVKRKHSENVPSKMTEVDFFMKFFQSHYFHRDRLMSGTKDIFTECAKIDDQSLKSAVAAGAGDPLLDLKLFTDNTLEEGFCGSVNSDKHGVNSGNIVHQNMIKRFNQHSIMVLNTSVDQSSNVPQNDTKASSVVDKVPINHTSEPQSKKARISEKIRFDDLDTVSIEDTSNEKSRSLNLNKVERYLHGPIPTSKALPFDYDNERSMGVTNHEILREVDTWMHRRNSQKVLVSATAAVNALGELSPGGALMRGFQEQSLAQIVPPPVEKDLRSLYLSLNELLRHFWQTFPVTTPEQETKLVRMHEALQRFQMAKLQPFETNVMRELSPLATHLNGLLTTALQKFMVWQERKMRQSR